MNIFFLDRNLELNSKYHFDKHVVKMCVEYAQILSTATHILIPNNNFEIYKMTHINHPCVRWAAESELHFKMVLFLLYHLGVEFEFRFGHTHKSTNILKKIPNKIHFKFTKWIRDPPLAMPPQFHTTSVIDSYRTYYKYGKNQSLHIWTKRNIPDWWSVI